MGNSADITEPQVTYLGQKYPLVSFSFSFIMNTVVFLFFLIEPWIEDVNNVNL